jgi:hypothetical protein
MTKKNIPEKVRKEAISIIKEYLAKKNISNFKISDSKLFIVGQFYNY